MVLKLELHPICLLAVWPVSVSYRHLPVGIFGLVCTVFLYCKIWRELHFVKFCGNSPQKGGLVHQKEGRSEGKRGSHQMYDTKTYQPSFPPVLVRKIPRKYQPIPNWNTKSGCNSSWNHVELNLYVFFFVQFFSFSVQNQFVVHSTLKLPILHGVTLSKIGSTWSM